MSDKELSVEEKLKALFDLQSVMSSIDNIRTIRGELPLEVKDLEDEIAGLETRINNYEQELDDLESEISNRKNKIAECEMLIKKYQEQQNNVRNNREYDSLSKEIEFNGLEIQLAEKHISEFKAQIAQKTDALASAKLHSDGRKTDLENKNAELDEIIAETQHDEEAMKAKGSQVETLIEPRLLTAFKRIRRNAHNGLAVVTVERDACGGCFNKIPPQRQLDIRLRKKIIVCEYCGRILVDNEMGMDPSGEIVEG